MQHEIIERIKKEFYLLDMLQDEVTMESISDDIVSFHIPHDNGGFHEIMIIVDNLCLSNRMILIDILNQKDIFYLCHRYFGNDVLVKKSFGEYVKNEDK